MTAIVPAHGARSDRDRDVGSTPVRRRGQHLRPLERPRPKRSPAVPALVAVGIVITALLGLAGMHALLIGGQVRLDAMRSDVAAETESIRRLELRVAELESPDRVLDAARDRLGMVQPTEVGYLLPASVDVPDAEPVRVEAATLDGGTDATEEPEVTEDPEVTEEPDRDADAGAEAELSEGGGDE